MNGLETVFMLILTVVGAILLLWHWYVGPFFDSGGEADAHDSEERTEYKVYVLNKSDYKTSPKLTFAQFSSFFVVNPKAWSLYPFYVKRSMESDPAKMSHARTQTVYFSTFEDTKIYREFYKRVQDGIKQREEEERRRADMLIETRNTEDIIRLVAKDIEDVKDKALQQRRDAVSMMSKAVDNITEKPESKV